MAESSIEWTEYTWNPVTGCKQFDHARPPSRHGQRPIDAVVGEVDEEFRTLASQQRSELSNANLFPACGVNEEDKGVATAPVQNLLTQ